MHDKYALVELNERFGGIKLPEIEIIDTRQVVQKGKVMISPQLKEAMQKALEDGQAGYPVSKPAGL